LIEINKRKAQIAERKEEILFCKKFPKRSIKKYLLAIELYKLGANITKISKSTGLT
jgi:hypothetical protein